MQAMKWWICSVDVEDLDCECGRKWKKEKGDHDVGYWSELATMRCSSLQMLQCEWSQVERS